MTSETPSPAPTGRAPLPLLGLGLLVCGLYLFAEQSLLGGRIGFPLDDSWIHLQFARNLAQGAGLSYNPGELVTGSTAPLWTALLSLVFLLPAGAVVVATKLLGVALHLAGIDAVWRLAQALGLGRKGAALAALLHLSTSWMVWSALSGMEIPLFVLLSLWACSSTSASGATRAASPSPCPSSGSPRWPGRRVFSSWPSPDWTGSSPSRRENRPATLPRRRAHPAGAPRP
jgi:hypothetical protein